MNKTATKLTLFLSASLLLGASAAWADDAAPAADSSRIEPITVYARKRAEDVQTVPVPVTVITSQETEQQNLNNFTDFQTKFPAFSVYLTNPKQLNLGVRGIGNNGFNTDGIDSSVGVFVDGVYSGRPGMVSTDFSDIDSIDLLRGPQGTLFGKNTTAGALLINTKKPTFTPELSLEATGGDYNLEQYKFSASGPIIADKLAIRLSGFYSEQDGDYANEYPGGAAANAREGSGLRLQLLATPTDRLTIRLIGAIGQQAFNTLSPITMEVYNPAALQARMAAAGYSLLVSNAATPQIDLNTATNAVTHSNYASAQGDYDMGKAGTLTSITGFEAWNCYTNNDNDYTQLDALTDYGSCNVERQFSQELRWASPKDQPLETVVGAYYSDQELQVNSRVRFGTQYYIWATNPSTTAFPNKGASTWATGYYTGQVAGAGFASQADFHTDTQALFANFDWRPDPDRKWSLDGGLRQTWEYKSMNYNGWVASNPGALSLAQLDALSPSGANAQLGTAQDAVTDISLSGQASVSYRFTPNLMTYVSVSRGHKSKGFNLLPENSTNPDPNVASAIAHGANQDILGEQTDNIEAGVKSEWLDHRLLLNLTLFDTYVANAQANEAIGVGNTATKFLANVGAERSEGVELEGQARPMEGLSLKGFVGYDDAYYASFRNSVCPAEYTALTCDLTGRQLAWAPRWTTDLTVEYQRSLIPETTQYIMVDTNWRSTQNTTITLDPLAQIGDYALTSVRVGSLLRHDSVDLQLWVENLFNRAYYINMLGLTKSTGLVQGYPGNPREFGITVRAHF